MCSVQLQVRGTTGVAGSAGVVDAAEGITTAVELVVLLEADCGVADVTPVHCGCKISEQIKSNPT